MRLLAEVTRFHARDSIPPDGGGGLGHSLRRVGAFMRPRDGGGDCGEFDFVGGFSGYRGLRVVENRLELDRNSILWAEKPPKRRIIPLNFQWLAMWLFDRNLLLE